MLIDSSAPVPHDIHICIRSRLEKIPKNRACYTVLKGILQEYRINLFNTVFEVLKAIKSVAWNIVTEYIRKWAIWGFNWMLKERLLMFNGCQKSTPIKVKMIDIILQQKN